MTHRPYPSIDRARHQLDRHDDETSPYREPRPMTPFERQLFETVQVAVQSVAPIAAVLRTAFAPRSAGSEEKTA